MPFLVLLFSLYVIAGGFQIKGDLPATPTVNTTMLGDRGAPGQPDRDDRSVDGADPPLAPDQPRPRACPAHGGLLHLPRLEHRRLPAPARRPAAVSGLPERRAVRLDALPDQALALLRRRAPVGLFRLGPVSPIAARPRSTWRPTSGTSRRLRLHGTINLLWLLGVVLAVALIVPGQPLPGTDIVVRDFVREGVLLGLTGLSLATTPRGLRKDTEFSHAAIIEVGCLFFGIFLTMQVPIEILQARGAELQLTTPAHFFWATGLLSSFLDNAPTYIVFFETARSLPASGHSGLLDLIGGAIRPDLLAAISLGAVFMGANTYIGNAPNMMVKLIAEQRRVKMPSFFGYMLYSGGVLLPLFALTSLLFFP